MVVYCHHAEYELYLRPQQKLLPFWKMLPLRYCIKPLNEPTATKQEYPIEAIKEGNYDNPKNFVALWAIIAAAGLAVAFVIFQFRHEIRKFFIRHFRRAGQEG